MNLNDPRDRLQRWFALQMPNARDVAVDALDRVIFGHSAEMLTLGLAYSDAESRQHRDFVLRVRPEPPGLLEPYDLGRQFAILRALESTPVPAPRVFWHETSGDVLGREFYVMERSRGVVYEGNVPADLRAAPDRVRRMSESVIRAVAAMHRLDATTLGLGSLDRGDYLEGELAHWRDEFRRMSKDRLPALERLAAELGKRRPEATSTTTLVHGDAKPGNFAFEYDQVSAVFDWELARIGDPLADIGWLEYNWNTAGAITAVPGALTIDEALAIWERDTGIVLRDREWYRALAIFKMAVILFVGAMLFDEGFTDDLRLASYGGAVQPLTMTALAELGIDESIDSGPVTARPERVNEVRAAKKVSAPIRKASS